MSPPPPSLGALVERGVGRPRPLRPEPPASSPWVWVVVVALVASAFVVAALTVYSTR